MRLAPTQRELSYHVQAAGVIVIGVLFWVVVVPMLGVYLLLGDKSVPDAKPAEAIIATLNDFKLDVKITPTNPRGLTIMAFRDSADYLTCELPADQIASLIAAMRTEPAQSTFRLGELLERHSEAPGWWKPSGPDLAQLRRYPFWLYVSPTQRRVWAMRWS